MRGGKRASRWLRSTGRHGLRPFDRGSRTAGTPFFDAVPGVERPFNPESDSIRRNGRCVNLRAPPRCRPTARRRRGNIDTARPVVQTRASGTIDRALRPVAPPSRSDNLMNLLKPIRESRTARSPLPWERRPDASRGRKPAARPANRNGTTNNLRRRDWGRCVVALLLGWTGMMNARGQVPPPAAGTDAPPVIGTDVGEMYPDFYLPRLDGGFGRLSDYRGRRVLLVHFASW